MALNTGKILMRRGQEANFDPDKMEPGEWAVSLDSKYVRMCFSAGVCVRMATYDAFEADMVKIEAILTECQTVEEAVQRIYEEVKNVAVDVERIETAASSALQSEKNALASAETASESADIATSKADEALDSAISANQSAQTAVENAGISTSKAEEVSQSAENVKNMYDLSKSYAIGGTGTREGENTDNAKYYKEQSETSATRAEEAAERAEFFSDVGIATTEKAGVVKPDGVTMEVSEDGTITVIGGGNGEGFGTLDYEELENKPFINGIVLSGDKSLDELGIQKKGDYLTNETDPTVPSWAKASEKPTYTAHEVGADIAGSASAALSDAKSYADEKINALVNGAPETLDTLLEISDALEENKDVVEAINVSIGGKLDKTGDSKDNTVTFVQAVNRENIVSTEKHSTLFGKIAKWYSELKAVAFSGSYNDLNNKPTIPTVNNATLSIQKNGVDIQNFTSNSSENKIANLIVPEKTSELENDSGFISTTTILDTYEEIMANTGKGKFAGAVGVKEGFEAINDSLGGLSFAQDENGSWGYRIEGADAVIPFKSSGYTFVYGGRVSPSGSGKTITIEFPADCKAILWATASTTAAGVAILGYNAIDSNIAYRCPNNANMTEYEIGESTSSGSVIEKTDTTIGIKPHQTTPIVWGYLK